MKWVLSITLVFLLLGSFIIVQAHQTDLQSDEPREEFIFMASNFAISLGLDAMNAVNQVVLEDTVLEANNGNNS